MARIGRAGSAEFCDMAAAKSQQFDQRRTRNTFSRARRRHASRWIARRACVRALRHPPPPPPGVVPPPGLRAPPPPLVIVDGPPDRSKVAMAEALEITVVRD